MFHTQLRLNLRPALRLLAGFMTLTALGTAQAAMFKCTDASGKVVYADKPCGGDPKATAWQPKAPLNVVSSESLTGKKPQAKDNRPSWLKPLDPVGDCKKKGGKIDPELRACMLP